MLVIHHLGISVSERVVWLCEELGIPYELKIYQRDPKTNLAPAEYKALHPFQTSPVIDDGDVRLSESGAVIEYILNKHASEQQRQSITVSKDDKDYADYLYWEHFTDASLHGSMMLNSTVMRLTGGQIEHETLKNLANRLYLGYEMLEKRLKNRKFVAGEKFTIADLLLFFPISTMRNFIPIPKSLDNYPNVKDYIQRLGDRDAYKRTVQKADPQRGFVSKL
ncbi:glutathione S-transferase [Meira miltonrushii]|uniref:glutathione transferase n=1 Tax=Meira miltonrushii TaxID=1280837 RepID=A0A316VJV3_9BASI|nr:glutathione S-transferase [Meira miltonrushii]PWN36583.1 glutathione S-transferase [Meira miltonrushii]